MTFKLTYKDIQEIKQALELRGDEYKHVYKEIKSLEANMAITGQTFVYIKGQPEY